MAGSAPRLEQLVLWLTTACNLSCAYCYRGRVGGGQAMDRATAMEAMELAARGGGAFHVQLAGGEPTLEPGLIEAVAQRVRQKGWPATIAVQTNATALDAPLAAMLARWGIGVGVSLDGPPEVHERLRGGFQATMGGLARLEAAGVDFGVTAAVSAENVGSLPELAMLLAGFNHARGLGLDLLVRRGRAMAGCPAAAAPEALARALGHLSATLSWLNQRRARPLVLREAARLARGAAPYCPACRGASLAVHPDGGLFPCGQTMGDPELALGSLGSPDWRNLAALGRQRLAAADCAACPLAGRCPGECPSRLKYNGPRGRAQACAMWRALAADHQPHGESGHASV